MTALTLYLGNKNYSSWSLRAWLMLKRTGIDFAEEVIPLREPGTREAILRHSPSGKVPVLVSPEVTVWDSLAIGEYLAENYPKAGLWPKNNLRRAKARAVSAEMHSGFLALRREMPMNIRAKRPGLSFSQEALADVNRISAIWRDCRLGNTAGRKPFLFGDFTIADAMFAPVVLRFITYDIAVEDAAGDYMNAIMDWPAMKEWCAQARNEPWIVSAFERE